MSLKDNHSGASKALDEVSLTLAQLARVLKAYDFRQLIGWPAILLESPLTPSLGELTHQFGVTRPRKSVGVSQFSLFPFPAGIFWACKRNAVPLRLKPFHVRSRLEQST
jgi:hypothetical protein